VRNIFSLPMSALQWAGRSSSSADGAGGSSSSSMGVSSVAVPKALHFAPGVAYDTKFFDASIDYALIPTVHTQKHEVGKQQGQGLKKGEDSSSSRSRDGRGNSKLSVTGLTVNVKKVAAAKRAKKAASGAGAGEVLRSSRDSEATSTSTTGTGTANKKSSAGDDSNSSSKSKGEKKGGKSVTTSRREKTAARIHQLKREKEEQERRLDDKHRAEVASQLSPTHSAVKRQVAEIRKESKKQQLRDNNSSGFGGGGQSVYVFCSMFFLLFLIEMSLSLSYLSIDASLHSLTQHGTSLTIISIPQSINQSTNQYSHDLLPCRYSSHPTLLLGLGLPLGGVIAGPELAQFLSLRVQLPDHLH
jgi:hypothetical protein